MKLSIITVSFNSASTIENTIKSVITQNYPDLEYIIIDGGSTDGTLAIINKYQDRITKIISEPDQGIYGAMSKGIKIATGDVIGILNSDDFYCDNHILSDVMAEFVKTNVNAVYGDIVYVDQVDTKKHVRYWRAGEYQEKKLNSGWIMPHPAFFVKKEVYNKFGLFNLDFKIAADYELMLRFLKRGLTISYLPQTLVCMRAGGYSAAGLSRRRAGWQELQQAWRFNNLPVPLFFIVRRILHKISQYI